jgi:hypothetical protein
MDMSTLCEDYSGITINQNASPNVLYPWRTNDGALIYQTFQMPSNYGRGNSTNGYRYPDLTGLQVFVNIDIGSSAVAALTYSIEYNNGSWVNMATGTITGAQADGDTWFDVILGESIVVTEDMAGAQWRFSITADTSLPGINGVYYVTPATIGAATESDGTVLVSPSACLNFRILGLEADNGIDFLGNEYRSLVVQATAGNVQTTEGLNPVLGSGQAPYWQSQALPSPYAVESIYFDVRDDDDFVVIDSVLIDPGTPNMYVNIYYSTDDEYTSDSMTASDWEQKLWSRVPNIYQVVGRQNYALPAPIHAKYMKLEFVNPQGQSYDPGQFQLPVSYKKFPTWVSNYFLQQYTLPVYTAGTVAVQYDALSLAYDYYLDDLQQLPNQPSGVPSTINTSLGSYFTSPSSNAIDPTTLSQINLMFNSYQSPLGTFVNSNSTLGSVATQLRSNLVDGPVKTAESSSVSFTSLNTVSSLNRDSVLSEQTLPDMYFFITCRHMYKELTATFDYNRAYFFSVNDVAFMRNNYTVISDTPLYIETGADSVNSELCDFVVDGDGIWYSYE